ncbi:MAG: stage III sporulation protein AG [Clostridium sp.]|jgi:stage III sporulation protein AG|uniref:stage III sporulation protein AG n=1 Tax=Clostridium sp. TaxID=1506 RepID=UPI0025B9775F|nr:stage III sporulation protein AG [Clostridium sp.]MCH3964150.1 stage III sporulation protein AG [Clostridium sp.]MCI1715331.1 stage III sporulation protein AG [Clostridium sp.]MCI1799878.1 stage III sporulation protein AG [Clostridium sp.]MCI1813514.1 stage III sporulation protein AG [Clostridium sp.]MCI1870696.1 stage III sporulation protein AG [Clostridium sp.]
MNFKKWFSYIKEGVNNKSINSKNKNKTVNLIIIFLMGILMLITVSFFKTSDSNKSESVTSSNSESDKTEQTSTKDTSYNLNDYEKSVEDKLKSTLENIDGVGKVDVMINFESGEEQVPAVNVNDSTNTTNEKDNSGGTRTTTQSNNGSTVVITNDGEKSEPLIVKTYKPKVSGVCVVAEGAENKITELRISKAVVDLFDITEDKVNVYPMKK